MKLLSHEVKRLQVPDFHCAAFLELTVGQIVDYVCALKGCGTFCRVVTFGSPKAGNIEFAASVYATVGRTYRVVHRNDAVGSPTPLQVLIFEQSCHDLKGNTCTWKNSTKV